MSEKLRVWILRYSTGIFHSLCYRSPNDFSKEYLSAIEAELVECAPVAETAEEIARLKAEIEDLDAAVEDAAHGDPVKGAEAEELRQGIERIIRDCSNEHMADSLQRLLDEIDARDSLAFLERHPEVLRLKAELAEARRQAMPSPLRPPLSPEAAVRGQE